jgi:hypothetical protein
MVTGWSSGEENTTASPTVSNDTTSRATMNSLSRS